MKRTYKELALDFQNTKSQKTFKQLYEKMKPGLWGYISRIVKCPDAADDIFSVTLTKIYNLIDDYNPDYQITTWAYKIAYNDALGYLNKQKKKISMNVFTDKGIEPPSMYGNDTLDRDIPITESDLVEADNIFQERFDTTVSEIHKLPILYKRYMIERFLNNKSYNDILEIMSNDEKGISLQTVKNRIFRGKKIIKNKLEKTKLFNAVI
tara:strand:+ start:11204 stop:11830 length:627 start_codon:yes stop_codon:yes gene_type:complete